MVSIHRKGYFLPIRSGCSLNYLSTADQLGGRITKLGRTVRWASHPPTPPAAKKENKHFRRCTTRPRIGCVSSLAVSSLTQPYCALAQRC